ncbi:MAG: ribonucleotide-diphosphate reductase subunit alpha, partial [Alphaproteobacteria bacterium]
MDFRDSGQGGTGDVATVMDEVLDAVAAPNKAAPAKAQPKEAAPLTSSTVVERRFDIVTDASRDALLTEFGKDTLNDRYLLPGESYQDLFARVA